jgi:REP element-mobilizing transposase RayT
MRERKLNRKKGYDYSNNGIYFITSCIHKRMHLFGKIEHEKMELNDFGEIAQKQWEWLAKQYPYVILHNFVVMPNHIHGLIEIDDNLICTDQKIKPLSQLMGAYKTTVSKQIHLLGNAQFKWQRSFHDRIVRNRTQFNNINNYITNNPKKWDDDNLK